MLIENESKLIKYKDWVFRIRQPEDKSSDRVLLLLHGWSGDENSMWVFTKDIPQDYWVISLRAPFSAGAKGYSWREIMPDSTWGLPKISEFQPTLNTLMEMLNDWAISNSVTLKTIDLIGFSQGATLVCALLLSARDHFEKAACLAGFMPDGGNEVAKPGMLSGTKIFVAHGTNDDMVPLSRGQEMVEILRYTGAQVEVCTENVGHKVGSKCFKGLENFFNLY